MMAPTKPDVKIKIVLTQKLNTRTEMSARLIRLLLQIHVLLDANLPVGQHCCMKAVCPWFDLELLHVLHILGIFWVLWFTPISPG